MMKNFETLEQLFNMIKGNYFLDFHIPFYKDIDNKSPLDMILDYQSKINNKGEAEAQKL